MFRVFSRNGAQVVFGNVKELCILGHNVRCISQRSQLKFSFKEEKREKIWWQQQVHILFLGYQKVDAPKCQETLVKELFDLKEFYPS